jgi:hypothetical protein
MILAAVLSLNIYRAVTQSLTVDEAFTYKVFVAAPWEEARLHVDPNNHVLNTLLEKISVGWWGPSEWAIRAPSLMGGTLYLGAALFLVHLLFGGTWASVVVFCAMILNPIVLDYMSAARGYSLALGFLFCGLLMMTWVVLKPGGRIVDACLHGAVGVAMGLSASANLAFAIPCGVAMTVWLIFTRKGDSEQIWLQAGLMFASAGLTFGELMFRTFEVGNVATFSLGEASAARSIYVLFLRSFQFPTVAGGHVLPPLLAVVTGPLLIASLMGAVASIRRPELLLFPLTLLGSVTALVALHLAAGLPYPYERTGIYMLPLMTLTVACGLEGRWKILSRSAMLFLCAITVQYALELKSGWYEEWKFDAGTKRAMQALMRFHGPDQVASRMGISWVYQDSATYYARLWHLDWLAPLTRDDPRSADFAYYYLRDEEQALVAERGLVILYRDPVSNAVLARENLAGRESGPR